MGPLGVRSSRKSLPISSALAPRSWWQEQGLVPVAQQLSLQEQLGLLLPEDLQAPAAEKATLRVIQRRAFRAVARGDGALLEASSCEVARSAGGLQLMQSPRRSLDDIARGSPGQMTTSWRAWRMTVTDLRCTTFPDQKA